MAEEEEEEGSEVSAPSAAAAACWEKKRRGGGGGGDDDGERLVVFAGRRGLRRRERMVVVAAAVLVLAWRAGGRRVSDADEEKWQRAHRREGADAPRNTAAAARMLAGIMYTLSCFPLKKALCSGSHQDATRALYLCEGKVKNRPLVR